MDAIERDEPGAWSEAEETLFMERVSEELRAAVADLQIDSSPDAESSPQ